MANQTPILDSIQAPKPNGAISHPSTPEPSMAELLARLAKLEADNDRLRKEKADALLKKGISCKVSEKGGVSVYGLGRFPITLYRGQWDRLFEHQKAIKDFIEANASKLATKEGEAAPKESPKPPKPSPSDGPGELDHLGKQEKPF